jgi:hypothetical protein
MLGGCSVRNLQRRDPETEKCREAQRRKKPLLIVLFLGFLNVHQRFEFDLPEAAAPLQQSKAEKRLSS